MVLFYFYLSMFKEFNNSSEIIMYILVNIMYARYCIVLLLLLV